MTSAFIGTGLEVHRRSNGIDELVVVGLITDHCVSTTVRMVANMGFRATVMADATATFDWSPDGTHFSSEQMHQVELASLSGEFATIATAREVVDAARG